MPSFDSIWKLLSIGTVLVVPPRGPSLLNSSFLWRLESKRPRFPLFASSQIMSVTLPADLASYRPITTDHEAKFASFLEFVQKSELARTTARDTSEFAIQLVTRVNYGSLISKRFFATVSLSPTGSDVDQPFVEITETEMVDMNLKKANAYKNFKSNAENRFYEMNLYLRDTTTKHHWRADIARPAAQIDL
ncbi:hypothetical protein MVEN_00899200 [Mycena venus]|uniref:Uncharacterized protein n=1 Tax=Mycena venus TaxID=2733690 RepID=A0A8H6YG23_9AGAR|nr:hypothetical protein MVEN_00899200 [Mycena venus]